MLLRNQPWLQRNQVSFLQSLLTFISRTFLSRALSILHSSAMHLSRLVALRLYSSSYCFWLSCQGESRHGEEPETRPRCDAVRVLLWWVIDRLSPPEIRLPLNLL